MPHGGPVARDEWEYFFLREFLVSRGYAVLQMNFRGSSGYGSQWYFAAHQDWGGLTYDDIVDATRWAIEQQIADPARICIVGWSFGGYAALLGAQRNADLFRCSVDIAGVSDLGLLLDEGHGFIGSEIERRQIGTDSAKLKRDSPRRHAAEFSVPVLMLHGTMDGQVPIEQSEVMDRALSRAGKAHRFVRVRDADHAFSEMKDRITMLQEIEQFLGEHLPPSVAARTRSFPLGGRKHHEHDQFLLDCGEPMFDVRRDEDQASRAHRPVLGSCAKLRRALQHVIQLVLPVRSLPIEAAGRETVHAGAHRGTAQKLPIVFGAPLALGR
jgi:dienelactone hydrolase